jgi:hypothetical protein
MAKKKMKKATAKKKPPATPQELGIDDISSLIGGSDIDKVTIENVNGKKRDVSLDLPAAIEIKATKPLLKIRDQIMGAGIELPERRRGESAEDYQTRAGISMLDKFTDVMLAMVSEELLEAAAAILNEPIEEVGNNYKTEELIAFVLPFFKRLLGGIMRRGQAELGLATPLKASESQSDS